MRRRSILLTFGKYVWTKRTLLFFTAYALTLNQRKLVGADAAINFGLCDKYPTYFYNFDRRNKRGGEF